MFSWLASSLEVRKDKEDEYLTFDCLRDPDELAKQQELLYVAVTCLFFFFFITVSAANWGRAYSA